MAGDRAHVEPARDSPVTESADRSLLFVMKRIEVDFFTDVMRRLDPRISIVGADSPAALDALYRELPRTTRLIAFSTNVIVPAEILVHFHYNCINFHPGPPDYPGYRPTGFALYQGARRFGVTAHYMVDRVDEGPIVATETFDIAPDAELLDVVGEAYGQLARLFVKLAPRLIETARPLPRAGVSWSGRKSTRASYEAMRRVEPGVDAAELALRIRCFDGVYTPLT